MATVTYIPERKQTPSAMKGVMRYCSRKDKTWDAQSQRQLVSGINCDGQNAITEFMATKEAHGKTDGMNFYQYVQSFSPQEEITPLQAHEIAKEFAAQAWPGHEVQVCTHCDAQHIHSHFVINSVSFESGKKLRQDPNTLRQLRALSDTICQAHGLNILPPYERGGRKMSAREYRAAQKGQSWKFKLMYHIGKAMEASADKEDFIKLMNRSGYEVSWAEERKHITFTCPNGMKCRGSRLHHEKYLKESFENEFAIRKRFTGSYLAGISGEEQRAGSGSPWDDTLPTHRLRNPEGMAGGGGEAFAAGRRVPADAVPADRDAGNSPGDRADDAAAHGGAAIREAGGAEPNPELPKTGWEREREVFFRLLQNAVRQSQGYGNGVHEFAEEAYENHSRNLGNIHSPLGLGLRGIAALGGLIGDSSEDPEKKRERILAEQNGSDIGAVLGLAVGVAMALTQEEQEIQEQEDYNEFVAEQEYSRGFQMGW